MQTTLSIDVSTEPAQGVIIQTDNGRTRVIEQATAELGSLFSKEAMIPLAKASQSEEESPEANEPISEQENLGPAHQIHQDLLLGNAANPFGELLSSFKSTWDSSILIVPPYDFLSLSLDLPFSDSKHLKQVLDLEVQDLVPFDITEFLLQHESLAPRDDKAFDTFVSLTPKVYIQNILRICKGFDFEPVVVTTPASALSGLYKLAGEDVAQNAVVACARDTEVYLSMSHDSIPRSERVIHVTNASGGMTPEDHVLSEMARTVAAFEERYDVPIESIHVIGNYLDRSEIETRLKKPVHSVQVSNYLPSVTDENQIAGLAGTLNKGDSDSAAITNFRAREFAFSPKLIAIIRESRRMLPYLVALLALAVVGLCTKYALSELRIHRLRSTMVEQIERILPEAQLPNGTELRTVGNARDKLKGELGELGSQSKINPLDALLQISQNFSVEDDATITKIKIEGNEILIDALAPDFAIMESITSKLKKKSNVFCKVIWPGRSSGSEQRTFKLRIKLC